MPSFTTAKIPKPKSWSEFEDIVSDIIQIYWKDPFIVRNGRQGQGQQGVDIYGKPFNLDGGYAGVQCKDKNISEKEVIKEIKKAEEFKPALKEIVIATTSERDSVLQEKIRLIDESRINEKKFSVRILFWEDICLKLAESDELMIKHFPSFVQRTNSLENIRNVILGSSVNDWAFDDEEGVYVYKKDTNLRIVRDPFDDSDKFEEEWLKSFADQNGFRDIHKIFYGNTLIERLYLVSIDGARCSIPYPDIKNHSITEYQYKTGKIINDSFSSRAYLDFDGYLRRAKIKIE